MSFKEVVVQQRIARRECTDAERRRVTEKYLRVR
jgi:hypothetical protein